MDFNKKLEKLESSDVFKGWKKKNSNAKLAHFFVNINSGAESWEIGFYDEKNNVMTHFIVDDVVSLGNSEKPLKYEDTKIVVLDLNKVDISLKNALAVANSLIKKEYPKHKSVRILALLQSIKDVQVWNITFISASFDTLNIKVDADNGDVISHKSISLIDRR